MPAKSYIELQCSCGTLILKSYANGKTKLRARLVIFDDFGKGLAVCRDCGSEVAIPVQLQKAFSPKTEVRHYVLEKAVDR